MNNDVRRVLRNGDYKDGCDFKGPKFSNVIIKCKINSFQVKIILPNSFKDLRNDLIIPIISGTAVLFTALITSKR